MARIGVEPVLSNISAALEALGHDVVALRSEADANQCDCCIISGTDKDMMGISNVVIKGPVINAEGSTTDEVCQMVSERLR